MVQWKIAVFEKIMVSVRKITLNERKLYNIKGTIFPSMIMGGVYISKNKTSPELCSVQPPKFPFSTSRRVGEKSVPGLTFIPPFQSVSN